jgi:Esterase/lipase
MKKAIIITLAAITALALTITLCLTVSPVPASMLMRKMFETPNLAPPDGYTAMETAVTAHTNLTYPSEYADNTLDIYLPKQADTALPVILWVHGGAYVGGDKSDARYYCTALASNGYAVISMNYQRAPEATFPTPIVQIADAYAWITSAEESYSLDPTKLVLAGDSAGAHSAALFALIQRNPAYAEKFSFTASLPPEHLKGLLLYCGPYNVQTTGDISNVFGLMINRAGWAYFETRNWATEMDDQATVKHHITAQFPPSFITDSAANSFDKQGKELAEELKKLNVPVTSYFPAAELEKTTHEYQFLMNTPAGAECYRLTLKFLKTIL